MTLNIALIDSRIQELDARVAEVYSSKAYACLAPEACARMNQFLRQREEWIEIRLICALHNAEVPADEPQS